MITRIASRIVFTRNAVATSSLRLHRHYSDSTLSPIELESILAKQIDHKLTERPNFKQRFDTEMLELAEL